MKYLHTMVRVSDLDKSLDFYVNKLGLKEVRRMDNAQGRFTLVYLAAPEDKDAEVELTTLLGNGSVSLSKLVDLKPGDVLPCDFTGKATVLAEGVPLFRGAFGVSRGQQCVRYEQRIRRPGPNAVEAALLRKNS